jgi:hypothetical protein
VPIRGRENVMGFAIDTKKGAYFIYGWLVVGRKVETYSDISNPEIERRHPHATKDYFEMQPDNALYIAADTLSLNGFTYLGCGYFPRLSKKLLAASHNWWKFDRAIFYTLLSSKSILLGNLRFL